MKKFVRGPFAFCFLLSVIAMAAAPRAQAQLFISYLGPSSSSVTEDNLDGSLIATIARGTLGGGVATEGDNLYFGAITDYSIANGTTHTVVSVTGTVTGSDSIAAKRVEVSGSTLYVENYRTSSGTFVSSSIGAYTTSGGTINALLISGLNSESFAVSDTSIFALNLDGTIAQFATSGTEVSASFANLSGVDSLAVSGSTLFVGKADGSVGEYSTSGATIKASLLTTSAPVAHIAVSGSTIVVEDLDPTTRSAVFGEYRTDGSTINADLFTLDLSSRFAQFPTDFALAAPADVPEPSTRGLVLCGVVGLLAYLRWRGHRASSRRAA